MEGRAAYLHVCGGALAVWVSSRAACWRETGQLQGNASRADIHAQSYPQPACPVIRCCCTSLTAPCTAQAFRAVPEDGCAAVNTSLVP